MINKVISIKSLFAKHPESRPEVMDDFLASLRRNADLYKRLAR